jgi:hypothetical protein
MEIIIDPGHGGRAPAGSSSPLGVRGPGGTLEKDVTLELARRVSAHLGRGVGLTRYGDSNPTLAARAHAARRLGARVFLSLHANDGSGGRGAETWVHDRAPASSHALARALQGALGRLGGGSSGVRQGPLAVLTPERFGGGTAACLLEVDQLAHPDGERRLRSPQGLDQIARAIAQAVNGFLGPRGRAPSRRGYGSGLAAEAGTASARRRPTAMRPARALASALAQSLIQVAGSADATDGTLVATELDGLPESMLQALSAQGTKVVVCRGSVTDYMTTLRGVTPRGWPAGRTWDGVPGLSSTSSNEVVIATVGHGTAAGAHVPRTGEGHGAFNLVLHESTHAVDLNQGGGNPARSSGPNFTAARAADLATLSAYESQAGNAGVEETYAESSARYFGSDANDAADHPNLHGYWPVHTPGPFSDPNS